MDPKNLTPAMLSRSIFRVLFISFVFHLFVYFSNRVRALLGMRCYGDVPATSQRQSSEGFAE